MILVSTTLTLLFAVSTKAQHANAFGSSIPRDLILPFQDIAKDCSAAQNGENNLCMENSVFAAECQCSCDRLCRLQRREIANQRIVRCCESQSIDPACMAICSYDYDRAMLSRMAFRCIKDFPKVLYCAAGGFRNPASRRCCERRNVTTHCMPFCEGAFPDPCNLNTQHLECSEYAWDTLTCLQDNIPYLPNYAKVKWDAFATPKNIGCALAKGLLPQLLKKK